MTNIKIVLRLLLLCVCHPKTRVITPADFKYRPREHKLKDVWFNKKTKAIVIEFK